MIINNSKYKIVTQNVDNIIFDFCSSGRTYQNASHVKSYSDIKYLNNTNSN